MSNIALDSVNAFLERVRTAVRARSKEVRLGISEAEDIALAFAQVAAKETTYQQQIIDLQRQIIDMQNQMTGGVINIDADAGSFKNPTN